MSYQIEAIKKLATEIKAAGFRVFIAERGTYGFYTNAEGSRIISFQNDLGGINFSGNYKTNQPSAGSGWQLERYGAYEDMLNQCPPSWALRGADWKYTTLEQQLKTYQWSSKFTEI